MGRGFWPWNFQGVSHNFAEFPGIVTNAKILGFFFSEKYILIPFFCIFSGIGLKYLGNLLSPTPSFTVVN